MDIVTIISTALALGAASVAKTTTELAIKDSYEGLKKLIQTKYKNINFKKIENAPDSSTHRQDLSKKIKSENLGADDEIVKQAIQLLKVISDKSPKLVANAGIDLERLTNDSSLFDVSFEQKKLLREKLKRLKAGHAIETDIATRLKLEVQIEQTENELSVLL